MNEEKRIQVANQCKAIAALCGQIAAVHAGLERIFRGGHLDELLDQVGKDTANLMEDLGNVVNNMDIVQAEDAWMEPIFDGAHAMFPVTPDAI